MCIGLGCLSTFVNFEDSRSRFFVKAAVCVTQFRQCRTPMQLASPQSHESLANQDHPRLASRDASKTLPPIKSDKGLPYGIRLYNAMANHRLIQGASRPARAQRLLSQFSRRNLLISVLFAGTLVASGRSGDPTEL